MTRLYRFLTAPDTAEFCHKVTKALADGWELYGDPQYAHDPAGGLRCGQAVIKEVNEAYDPEKSLGEY